MHRCIARPCRAEKRKVSDTFSYAYIHRSCRRIQKHRSYEEIGTRNACWIFKLFVCASNTMKLLDFLNFNLTNPMVPNLAHVFLSGWVSGTVLRGEFCVLLGENGYFLEFGHFCPNFKLIWHISKWILWHQKFWEVFIYILGVYQHNTLGHMESLNWKSIVRITISQVKCTTVMNVIKHSIQNLISQDM